jgi:hypothetical protein
MTKQYPHRENMSHHALRMDFGKSMRNQPCSGSARLYSARLYMAGVAKPLRRIAGQSVNFTNHDAIDS